MSDTRVLLFTGKGGVGKTTMAASTAVACADLGLRTMVLSTDPAHSLADAFGLELSSKPTEIAPHLVGQQLDAQERMEQNWSEIGAWLREVFDWAGVDAIQAEELSVVPGLDEVFALTEIQTHVESGDYDVVVVDCAPTSETIRLLSLPEVLSWYMDRMFGRMRTATKVLRPVMRRVGALPIASDDVFGAAEALFEQLDGVRAILSDPKVTSVRLVVNPERMVIAEARRTHTYLSMFGYRVDAVVANRLLPPEVQDPWFAPRRAAEAELLGVIEEGFAPLHVLRSHLVQSEPIGVDALRAFAANVYGRRHPTAVLHTGEPLTITRPEPAADGSVPDAYVLRLELPFAERDDLDVGRSGGDLLVRVGGRRRAIALPSALVDRTVAGAKLSNGVLTVDFGAPRAAAET